MNKTVKELVRAAKRAAVWMKDATTPNEINKPLALLVAAIQKAEQEQEAGNRSGYLVLVELGDGRKRITATVETGDKYLSRSGMASMGVDAEVTYSAEVGDLDQARETLRTVLQQEQWSGQGMTWAELSRQDLIAVIKNVSAIVNSRA
jgi:hypothetical protein